MQSSTPIQGNGKKTRTSHQRLERSRAQGTTRLYEHEILEKTIISILKQ
jgi:hypothetical protein